MAIKSKIKVVVVDDSAPVRAILTKLIESDERLQVVAAAADPYEARELIKRHNPDVITLDIEMPRMNGIAFLKNLMRLRPMPVVMISTLTQHGAPATLEALELGAIDFVPKPRQDDTGGLEEYRDQIIEKVVCAAQANIISHEKETPAKGPLVGMASLMAGKKLKPKFLCAIGASTGGTEAIKNVIVELPEESPPIVITQHIPAEFSASFAQRLDRISAVKVFEAEHDQMIQKGCVYVAPGHSHLRVVWGPRGYVCKLDHSDPVNRHRPSVSVLFDSVLESAGKSAIAVLLTGMGADGADALLRLCNAGCTTAAQDEASSVVWGMPGTAVKIGAAKHILPLKKVAKFIITQAYVETGISKKVSGK